MPDLTLPAPRTPNPLLVDARLRQRVTQAVIAQAGLRHESLNTFLRERLGGSSVAHGALFAEPAVEAAGSYKTTDVTRAALSGTLLHPRLVAALEGREGDCRRERRFAETRARRPSRR